MEDMKDSAIWKALELGRFIKGTDPAPEDLTCTELCQAKLAGAIAACSLLRDPIKVGLCINAAQDAYHDCVDQCDN
ncbi:hypothetical protein ACT7DF_07335 [Bacillus cereus]